MLTDLRKRLLAEAKPDSQRAIAQLLGTLLPLFLIWAVMLRTVEVSRLADSLSLLAVHPQRAPCHVRKSGSPRSW